MYTAASRHAACSGARAAYVSQIACSSGRSIRALPYRLGIDRDVREDFEDTIDALGGRVPAVESGAIQREIAEQAFRQQRRLESGEKIVVGVNRFTNEEKLQLTLFQPDARIRERQLARLGEVKRRRDGAAVRAALDQLKRAAAGTENVVPRLMTCVKAYCTVGEMNAVFLDVFGRFKEPVSI